MLAVSGAGYLADVDQSMVPYKLLFYYYLLSCVLCLLNWFNPRRLQAAMQHSLVYVYILPFVLILILSTLYSWWRSIVVRTPVLAGELPYPVLD